MSEKDLFSIGDISKICNISISTLRYYDEIGVIKPEKINEITGYRYYGKDTLLWIPILKFYKQYGFKLKEIRNLLNRNNLNELHATFEGKLKEYDSRIARIQAERDSLRSWQDLISEAGAVLAEPTPVVQMKVYPEIQALSCHPQGFANSDFMNLLVNVDIMNMLSKKDLITCGALYIEYPSRERRLTGNYDRCELHIEAHPHYGHESHKLLGFPALCAYHAGDHHRIIETYAVMTEWAGKHHFSLSDCVFERYVIDYWSTGDPDSFVTEIIIPLA